MFILLLGLQQTICANSNQKVSVVLYSTRNVPGKSRTMQMLPTVSYKADTLYFSTKVFLNNISVKLVDRKNSLVFSNTFSLSVGNEISLWVPDLTKGYTLYVFLNGEVYKGVIE